MFIFDFSKQLQPSMEAMLSQVPLMFSGSDPLIQMEELVEQDWIG
jgi:hypothetical protein